MIKKKSKRDKKSGLTPALAQRRELRNWEIFGVAADGSKTPLGGTAAFSDVGAKDADALKAASRKLKFKSYEANDITERSQ